MISSISRWVSQVIIYGLLGGERFTGYRLEVQTARQLSFSHPPGSEITIWPPASRCNRFARNELFEHSADAMSASNRAAIAALFYQGVPVNVVYPERRARVYSVDGLRKNARRAALAWSSMGCAEPSRHAQGLPQSLRSGQSQLVHDDFFDLARAVWVGEATAQAKTRLRKYAAKVGADAKPAHHSRLSASAHDCTEKSATDSLVIGSREGGIRGSAANVVAALREHSGVERVELWSNSTDALCTGPVFFPPMANLTEVVIHQKVPTTLYIPHFDAETSTRDHESRWNGAVVLEPATVSRHGAPAIRQISLGREDVPLRLTAADQTVVVRSHVQPAIAQAHIKKGHRGAFFVPAEMLACRVLQADGDKRLWGSTGDRIA